MKRFIIIGPQASGKGTQADLLALEYGVPHVSTGSEFRKEVAAGTPLGKEIEPYLDRGELVPQELNDSIVKGVLERHPEGMVLDGYPRTMHQAEFLDSLWKVDAVVVLKVPDPLCVERIGGRRICDNGHDYHIVYKRPEREGICDLDGLPLHVRDDDKPEAVAKRLSIYHEQTEPIIAHYAAQGKVYSVDGSPSIEEVDIAIAKRLDGPADHHS